MIKNNKYFLPPPSDDCDIKELLKRIAVSGAGRPIGSDGFPAGPWTAELLSDAISEISPRQGGVDLRTVQLWFQDNGRGIGPRNISGLARVLGCDDPELTGQWQTALASAQSRLVDRRRGSKSAEAGFFNEEPGIRSNAVLPTSSEANDDKKRERWSFSLPVTSEAIFSQGSPFDLPVLIFAGAVTLVIFSYMIGIHNVVYSRVDGLSKQVGFLWAPNWTVVFMVFLPMFFAIVIELLAFWRKDGRLQLANFTDQRQSDEIWLQRVESFSRSFWAVFVICIFVAGVAQWIGVSVIPLSNASRAYAIDWGKVALVKPELISVPTTLIFTGSAYLYMSLCFYLFFASLILLVAMIQDLWRSAQAAGSSNCGAFKYVADEISLRLMSGVFRCTVVGIMIAICMKVQSAYLASSGRDIVDWMVRDAYSAFNSDPHLVRVFAYRMPTHYSSFLIAVSSCVVFAYASIRMRVKRKSRSMLWAMGLTVALLLCGYLMIDAFAGFSIYLALSVLLAAYGMVDPGMRSWRRRAARSS